jgi:NitT/TauT family transport system ATP-binding protein
VIEETPAEIPIKTDNLAKRYENTEGGTLTVFEGINTKIQPKEFVSIIGSSGCGKTTLLRVLGGLEKPSEGTVYIRDLPEHEPTSEKGFVFQEDVVFPWRTVEENVRYGPSLRKWDEAQIQERVDQFIGLVGLSEFKDYYPKQLSGGMRKRVAIAMVFANNPGLLFMDEPFGSLDYVTKRTLQDELLEIWSSEQKTTLFVTHDLDEALYLSDRIIIMQADEPDLADIVEVPFDRPRNQSLKTNNQFQEMVEDLWRYLE